MFELPIRSLRYPQSSCSVIGSCPDPLPRLHNSSVERVLCEVLTNIYQSLPILCRSVIMYVKTCTRYKIFDIAVLKLDYKIGFSSSIFLKPAHASADWSGSSGAQTRSARAKFLVPAKKCKRRSWTRGTSGLSCFSSASSTVLGCRGACAINMSAKPPAKLSCKNGLEGKYATSSATVKPRRRHAAQTALAALLPSNACCNCGAAYKKRAWYSYWRTHLISPAMFCTCLPTDARSLGLRTSASASTLSSSSKVGGTSRSSTSAGAPSNSKMLDGLRKTMTSEKNVVVHKVSARKQT